MLKDIYTADIEDATKYKVTGVEAYIQGRLLILFAELDDGDILVLPIK